MAVNVNGKIFQLFIQHILKYLWHTGQLSDTLEIQKSMDHGLCLMKVVFYSGCGGRINSPRRAWRASARMTMEVRNQTWERKTFRKELHLHLGLRVLWLWQRHHGEDSASPYSAVLSCCPSVRLRTLLPLFTCMSWITWIWQLLSFPSLPLSLALLIVLNLSITHP